MNYKDIYSFLLDTLPYKRKSSTDWIVPTALGLGFGLAAGAVVGQTIAPAKGEETRRQVKDRAYKMKDRALTAANEYKTRVTEQLGHGSNGVDTNGIDKTYGAFDVR